jgi:hypothetical protein
VGSFNQILKEVIWPEARRLERGTAWVNEHPICKLFGDKITSLTRTQYDSDAVFTAFDQCREIARTGTTEYEPSR